MGQKVPVHARRANRIVATTREGIMVTIELYAGQASDGYKTDFRSRPAWWIRIRRHRGKRCEFDLVRRYTGRRLDQAERDYQQMAATVRQEPGITINESA